MSFGTGPFLLQLDLSYNALSSLDERVMHWESLEATDLQGNPWDCTCPMQWILDRVVPRVYSTRQDLLYELRFVRSEQTRLCLISVFNTRQDLLYEFRFV
jgi:hypothetical protein